jgi:hypothetical protein
MNLIYHSQLPERVASAQKHFQSAMTDGKMILLATAAVMVVIVFVHMFLESRKK